MAPIDFYYMPESPPCRAVEMAAAAAGVTLNKHYVNLATQEHLKDSYLQVNQLHKVPFIVDGDLRMGESRAIMMYLVSKYKPNDEYLYPKDPVERAKVDEMLFYDFTIFSTQSRLLRPTVFGTVKELDAGVEKEFRECLSYLNNRLAQNGWGRFLLGDHLTIADMSVTASLSFGVACEYDMEEFGNLVAYLERMKTEIPNYSEINDKAVENLTNFVRSKREAK